MRTKIAQIHLTENPEFLLYVIRDSVMKLRQMYAALLFLKKMDNALCTRPY